MNESTQTLLGNYHVVVLPDGTLFALTKLSDGTWVPTTERVSDKKTETQVEFEKRFENTATVPGDFVKPDTDTLTPDIDKMRKNHEMSRNHLDAYLGEILGDPDDIISGKIAVKEIKEVGVKRHVQGLIKALNAPKWNQIKDLIWK